MTKPSWHVIHVEVINNGSREQRFIDGRSVSPTLVETLKENTIENRLWRSLKD